MTRPSPLPRPPTRSSPRRSRAIALTLAIGSLGTWAPTPALALARGEPDALPSVDDPGVRDDENLNRAMAAFDRGSRSYDEARYQDALTDFLEAASLYASPDFQYNIGLCYEKLDKPEEAISAFRTYLKTKADARDRANVEDRIARLERMVQMRKEGKDPGPIADQPPPRQQAGAPGKPLVITGAVLLGVGAAIAIGGGVGFGIGAKRKSDELDRIQGGGNPDDRSFDQAQDVESAGKKLELGQIVMAAVGGAVAITGVALLAVGVARNKAARKGTAARITPAFGGGALGLVVSGRF